VKLYRPLIFKLFIFVEQAFMNSFEKPGRLLLFRKSLISELCRGIGTGGQGRLLMDIAGRDSSG
jgi:hypothetical protein